MSTISKKGKRDGFNRFPGLFIIGDESSLFHKPMIMRIPS